MKKYLAISASAVLSAVTAVSVVSCGDIEGILDNALDDNGSTGIGIHLDKNVNLEFNNSIAFGKDACKGIRFSDDIPGQCIIRKEDIKKPEISFNFSFDGLSRAELEDQRDNIDVKYEIIEDGKCLNVYLTDKATGESVDLTQKSVTDFRNTTAVVDIAVPEYFDCFDISALESDIGADELCGNIYIETHKTITAEDIIFDDSAENALIADGNVVVSTLRNAECRSNVSVSSDSELTYILPYPDDMGNYEGYDTVLLQSLYGKLTIDLNGNNYTDSSYTDIYGRAYPYIIANSVAVLPSYGDIEGNFYITNGEYFSVADRGEPVTAEQTPETTSAAAKTEKTTAVNTSKTAKTAKNTKPAKTSAVTETEPTTFDDYSENTYVEYHFRSKKLLEQHFQKHGGEFGDEFGYKTAKDYEKGASDVINNSDALHKTEKDDGDEVYYIESTNEFAVLSTDGYIRTYFRPDAGKKYYDKQ